MVTIRSFVSDDRKFVLSLAERLTVGMSPYRDRRAWLIAVDGWLETSISQHDKKGMIFIAEDENRERLGFASITSGRHFTGEPQAVIGEFAVCERFEGKGVGQALMEASENWARSKGFSFIALTTGAANKRALDFYRQKGFCDEDMSLVKKVSDNALNIGRERP